MRRARANMAPPITLSVPRAQAEGGGLAMALHHHHSAEPLRLSVRPEQHLLLFTLASSLRGAAHSLDGAAPSWFECVKGGVRLIPAGALYELTVPPFKRFDYLSVSIDPRVVAEHADESGLPRDRATLAARLSGTPVPVLSSLLESMALEAQRTSSLPRAVGARYAMLLARALVQESDVKRVGTPSASFDVQRAIDHLDAHFAENFAVAETAQRWGVSRWALLRAFRRRTGRSPLQYLLERRLDEAQRLLRCGALPVVEIAHAVGFSSQSHFGMKFRHRFGCSPIAYRRAGKGTPS